MALRFFLQCLVWALPIALGLGGYLLYHKDHLPAPRYTSNVAFNEKLVLAKDLADDGVKVVAVGSSMALNNLASGPVVESMGTTEFVNLGAWGMGIGETAQLLPTYAERLRPNTVIWACNLMDFVYANNLDTGEVVSARRCIQEGPILWDHLRHWDAAWFLRQMELNNIRFNDPGNYEYLGFDEHGGAPLRIPAERIALSRYDKVPPEWQDMDTTLYLRMEEIAVWLRDRNIELIVVGSPYREGVRTGEVRVLEQRHGRKLEGILVASGHTWVDGNERDWPDSMFNDSSHLEEVAAIAFTSWALERARVQQSAATIHKE